MVVVALVSNCRKASIRRGSQRSILLLILSSTVFMLIIVAGEGGDWDREVGFEVEPPPRNALLGLKKSLGMLTHCGIF